MLEELDFDASEIDELMGEENENANEDDGEGQQTLPDAENGTDNENIEDETGNSTTDNSSDTQDIENKLQLEEKSGETTDRGTDAITIQFNGQDLSFDSTEELQNFVNNVSNRQPKTPAELSFMQENGISVDDLALLQDIKAGKKEALAKVIKDKGIDLYDLEEVDPSGYKPQAQIPQNDPFYAQQEAILNSSKYAEPLKVFAKLDEAFVADIINNKDKLMSYVGLVESGMLDKLQGEAIKHHLTTGLPLEMSFNIAANKLQSQGQGQTPSQGQNTSQGQSQRPSAKKIEEAKRELSKRTASSNKSADTLDEKDIWNLSDEDFDKLVSEGEL